MDEELGELTENDFIIPPVKYEYLDHTADVQLHAWGDSLTETFEQCGMAMFGYMTELPYVQIKQVHTIEASADDMMGLLYHFLDELLFLFSAEPYLICKKLKIIEFNTEEFRIVCKCYGEEFEIGKHPQGSEVKAITYSAMQIIDEPKDNKFENVTVRREFHMVLHNLDESWIYLYDSEIKLHLTVWVLQNGSDCDFQMNKYFFKVEMRKLKPGLHSAMFNDFLEELRNKMVTPI